MSKLTVTNFSRVAGSPFKTKGKNTALDKKKPVVHEEILQKSRQDTSQDKKNPVAHVQEEILQKSHQDSATDKTNTIVHEEKTPQEKQIEKNKELQQKVTKKTAEYQSSKPSSGTFTEVVTHGAFTSKKSPEKEPPRPIKHETSPTPSKGKNGSCNSKSLLGFPSSANDLALDAKSDLESDSNISLEVKEKVIEKIFMLVSMVQHVYESKVRIMTEFEKFKDTHLKNEARREKDHSEQLYKLNMSFQNEVIQAIQQLKNELDFSRNLTNLEEANSSTNNKNNSLDFNISGDEQCSSLVENFNADAITATDSSSNTKCDEMSD